MNEAFDVEKIYALLLVLFWRHEWAVNKAEENGMPIILLDAFMCVVSLLYWFYVVFR